MSNTFAYFYVLFFANHTKKNCKSVDRLIKNNLPFIITRYLNWLIPPVAVAINVMAVTRPLRALFFCLLLKTIYNL